MTKAELLAQIAATQGITKVLTERLAETIEDINWYEVPVLETDSTETLGWKKSIYFYVTDEGTGLEAAYFYKAEPKQDLPVEDAIRIAIQNYIYSQANVINFNLLSYKEEVNGTDTIRMAIAEVYSVVDATNASKDTWILYQQNVGAISHRIIV